MPPHHPAKDSRYDPVGPEVISSASRRRSKELQPALRSDAVDRRRRRRERSLERRRSSSLGRQRGEPSSDAYRQRGILRREPTGLRVSEIRDARDDERVSRRRLSREDRDCYRDDRSEEWWERATTGREGPYREDRRRCHDRSLENVYISNDSGGLSYSFSDGDTSSANRTSITNGRAEYVPSSQARRNNEYSMSRCDASRASRMTGNATNSTPRMSNLRVNTQPKRMKSLPETRTLSSSERHYCNGERERHALPPRRPKLPTTPSSNVAFMEGRNNLERTRKDTHKHAPDASSNQSIGSNLKRYLSRKPKEVDYGIEPGRGSFDLVLVPKERKRRTQRSGEDQTKAMEVAESIVADSIAESSTRGSFYTKDLAKWSALSVAAAMAAMQHGGGERVAQVAAKTVLEEGRRKNPKTTNELASKVSVAVLEDGGDHMAAAAVAVAIMGAADCSCSNDSVRWSAASASQLTADEAPLEPAISRDWLDPQPSNEDPEETKSMADKRRQLKEKEAELAARNRALQEAAKANEEREQAVAALEAAERRVSDQEMRLSREKAKLLELEKQKQRPSIPGDASTTPSMASKRCALQMKEVALATRMLELEQAAQRNLLREEEVRERTAALAAAARAIEAQTGREDAKRRQLQEMEDSVARRDKELEAAAKASERKERELGERMASLDAATAALLARANDVQKTIDNRRGAMGPATAGLRSVDEGRALQENGIPPIDADPQEGSPENAGEFSVATPIGPSHPPEPYAFNQQQSTQIGQVQQPPEQPAEPQQQPPQTQESNGNMFEQLIGMLPACVDALASPATPGLDASHYSQQSYYTPTRPDPFSGEAWQSDCGSDQNSATNRALNMALEQALNLNQTEGNWRPLDNDARNQRNLTVARQATNRPRRRSWRPKPSNNNAKRPTERDRYAYDRAAESIDSSSTHQASTTDGTGATKRTGSLKQKLKSSFQNSFRRLSSRKHITANGDAKQSQTGSVRVKLTKAGLEPR
ncbi:hypothetical protein ACHAXT_011918 [Thalassiosira profunda]